MKTWTSSLKNTVFIKKAYIRRILVSFIITFVLSRIVFPSGMMPFAPALVAAAFSKKTFFDPAFAFIGCILGIFLSFGGFSPVYLFILVVDLGLVSLIRRGSFAKNKFFLLSLILSFVLTAFVFFAADAYKFFITVSECAFSCVLYILFTEMFKEPARKEHRSIIKENALFVIFLCAFFTIGTRDLSFGGFSVSTVILSAVCTLVSFSCGSIAGAGAAAFLTFILSCLNGEYSLMPVFTAAAFLSGITRNTGKIFSSLIFLVSAVFVMFLTGYTENNGGDIFSVLTGVTFFCLLPAKTVFYTRLLFGSGSNRNIARKLDCDRLAKISDSKINNITGVIDSIAEVFSPDFKNTDDSAYVFNFVKERVCRACAFCQSCWKNGDAVKKEIEYAYDSYVRNGVIRISDTMHNRCIKEQDFRNALDLAFIMNDMQNRARKNDILSKNIIKEQLKGIKDIIGSIKTDMHSFVTFDSEDEDMIEKLLFSAGVAISFVSVEKSKGDIRVCIKTNACNDSQTCRKINAVLNRHFKTKMIKSPSLCPNTGKSCSMEFLKQKRFTVKAEASSIRKFGSDACGDNFVLGDLPDSRFMMLLCDGMGSGKKARERSHCACSLTSSFLKAGFKCGHIIRSVNKLLVLSSSDDTYSTLDMCLIDKENGFADFVKIGSPKSFIVRDDKVIAVKDGALPIGIVDDIKPACSRIEIKDGDKIVMFSDGISDLAVDLENFVRNCIYMNDEKNAASEMLNMAVEVSGGRAKDDITVIVAGVYREK